MEAGNVTVIGYLRKKSSFEIGSSPWGIHYIDRDYPHELLIERMGQSGVKWTRLTARWASIEVEKGRYDWSHTDRLVDGLTAHGVNVFLGTSSGSHPAYQEFPPGELHPPTHVAAALEGYCRYAAAMVERYQDRVRHFEIWNEPNVGPFWRPEPDPKAYALMVRQVSQAMRNVDSEIKVIAGVLANVERGKRLAIPYTKAYKIGGIPYARAFMSEPGTAEAFDILTYHPYNPSPEVTLENILALKETVRELHSGLPIWQGECGCPSSGDTIHYRGDAPWGYNVQSKWALRRLLTDFSAGAEVSVYFLIAEFHGNLQPGSPELRMGYNTKGLIQHTTWEAKPAYYALQNLAATIDGSWQRAQDQVEIEVIHPGTFYGIGPHEDRFPCVPWQVTIKRDGVPMLAYWLPWRPQEIVQPATVRVDWPDVSWRAPVCVDLLTGQVSEARIIEGTVEVPLADYPMVLTERQALDLAEDPQQPSYDEIVSRLRWTY
jgi:hypothetical protein